MRAELLALADRQPAETGTGEAHRRRPAPPADKKGRALAVTLSGTTVATIAGVPGGSVIGTVLGWRATFWAVAALCLPAALGVLKGILAGRVKAEATGGPALRAELALLTRPRSILVMLLDALVNQHSQASPSSLPS